MTRRERSLRPTTLCCPLGKITSLFLAIILCTLTVGCKQNVDLPAVRALSQAVQTAEPSYAAIADDLYESCLRQVAWEVTGRFHLASPSVLGTKNSSTLSAQQQKVVRDAYKQVGVSATQQQKDLLATYSCDTLVKGRSQQWQAANNVLTGYFDALGAAAADDSKIDFGFTQLASAIGTGGILASGQDKSASTFASDLAHAVFAARRRALIAEQAEKAKSAVAFYAALLTNVAEEYKLMLDNEQGVVNSFYSQNFVAANIGLQTLETIRYRADWKAALTDINVRRTAANAYITSLKKLKSGNDDIADAAQRNDFGSIYAIASATVVELKPDILALQKAFK